MLFIALCFTLQRYKKNRRFPNKLDEIFINLLILTIGLWVEQLGSQMVGSLVGCWWGVWCSVRPTPTHAQTLINTGLARDYGGVLGELCSKLTHSYITTNYQLG